MIKRKITYVIIFLLTALTLGACKKTEVLKGEVNDVEDTLADASTDTVVENEDKTGYKIEEPIDLYGMYDQNDLLINTHEEEYEGIVLEIPQIDGLKDKMVQDRINQDILERVEAAYQDISDLRFLSYSTMANFSNVLSINVYMAGEAENSSKQIQLNYNLNNGEMLTFEDLFLSDTDILGIIHSAFRDMLIKDQMQGDYDENQLYKIVKAYSNAEDKMFAFTPSSILLYHNGSVASVKMIDIADEVAVYSRFVTEDSIYERDDIGKKNVFTCMDIPENLFEVWEFGYLEDNLWYDYTVLKEYFREETEEMHLEKYTDFKNRIYEEVYLKIAAYREIAKENPERFYILLLKPNVRMESESEWLGDTWNETYTGKAFVNKNIQFIEMSQETYEEVYKQKLIDAYRYEYLALQGGLYLEVTEENVICGQMTEELYYDYITGEQLVYE